MGVKVGMRFIKSSVSSAMCTYKVNLCNNISHADAIQKYFLDERDSFRGCLLAGVAIPHISPAEMNIRCGKIEFVDTMQNSRLANFDAWGITRPRELQDYRVFRDAWAWDNERVIETINEEHDVPELAGVVFDAMLDWDGVIE